MHPRLRLVAEVHVSFWDAHRCKLVGLPGTSAGGFVVPAPSTPDQQLNGAASAG